MGAKYPLNRTIVQLMSVVVLIGVVLPNTLTAGHWNYLISSNAEANAQEHSHGGDHDHSGHNQTPAPAPPDVQFLDDVGGTGAGAVRVPVHGGLQGDRRT